MSDQIKALIEELRARRGIASIQNARLMERAADALEALSHMEGWRPIETAPTQTEPGGYIHNVLIAAKARRDGRQIAGEAYWHDDENWWWANEGPGDNYAEPIHMNWTITHWQPLPEPPSNSAEPTRD